MILLTLAILTVINMLKQLRTTTRDNKINKTKNQGPKKPRIQKRKRNKNGTTIGKERRE